MSIRFSAGAYFFNAGQQPEKLMAAYSKQAGVSIEPRFNNNSGLGSFGHGVFGVNENYMTAQAALAVSKESGAPLLYVPGELGDGAKSQIAGRFSQIG